MNIGLIFTIAIGIFLGLTAFIYHQQIFGFFSALLSFASEALKVVWSAKGYILAFFIIYWLLEGFGLTIETSIALSLGSVIFYKVQKEEGGVKKLLKSRFGHVTRTGWFILLIIVLISLLIYLSDN